MNSLNITSADRHEDERLQKYMGARYGQRAVTEQKYEAAIRASSDIAYLSKTMTDIAYEFGHQPEAFRMMMKRHFPEVLEERERLRLSLGLSKKQTFGVRDSTRQKYDPALKLLRTTNMTIRQAAEATGVSMASLQQHILFYHKDLAALRLKLRTEALGKKNSPGTLTATGATSQPRGNIAEYYAEAVKILQEHPEITIRQAASQARVSEHNLACYLRRWHQDLLKSREQWRREKTAQRQAERVRISRTERAAQKYGPAIALIESGHTYSEASVQTGINRERLQWWVRHNRPDIHERAKENRCVMMPDGTRVMRRLWLLYQEATRVFCNTEQPVSQIASRFGLKEKDFSRFLHEKFPSEVARRRSQFKRIKA